jgi:hypothetical protein
MSYQSSKETKEYFVLLQLKYESIDASPGMDHTFTRPTDGRTVPQSAYPGMMYLVFLYAGWGVKKCVGMESIDQNVMEKFVAIRVMIDEILNEKKIVIV